MPSRNFQQDIEYGQKFWSSELFSGKIIVIDRVNRAVTVDFWEKGHRVYEFDQLFGNWTDDYGGTWMVMEP